MKFFSECVGKCCICAIGSGGCLAGHGDDDFTLASKEQLIERLNTDKYKTHRHIIIGILKDVYGYDYVTNT